jgi:hypothetical protein
MQAAFSNLGLQNIRCEYGGNGVECRGFRPLESVHTRCLGCHGLNYSDG